MRDLPLVLLTATISAYWFGVGVMIVRVRRTTRRSIDRASEQQVEPLKERPGFMWMIWVPLVVAWIALPYLALSRTSGMFALPAFATSDDTYATLRYVATLLALVSLAATARCWLRMGRNWRMDVSVATKTELITDGPFRHIRHPIYAFQILLMLCSAAIVPTLPMLVVAAVHIVLMNVKARTEERHLRSCHGDAYQRYVERTGRFFPRFGQRPEPGSGGG
jgi:protein-S-isoprenylcysteine O-methyltransferase Ste14